MKRTGLDERRLATEAAASTSPGHHAERVGDDGRPRADFRRIPVEQGSAILLREYHGFTTDEIGEITGVPAATVRTRIFYGLRSVRKMLRERGSRRQRQPRKKEAYPDEERSRRSEDREDRRPALWGAAGVPGAPLRKEIEEDPALRAEWEELNAARSFLGAWEAPEESPGFVFVNDRPAPCAPWRPRRRDFGRGFGGWSRVWSWGLAATAAAVLILAVNGFRVETVDDGLAFRFGHESQGPAVAEKLRPTVCAGPSAPGEPADPSATPRRTSPCRPLPRRARG